MDRGRGELAAAMALTLLCAVVGCQPAATAATAAGESGEAVHLSGAGATFPEPIYIKWAGKYAELNDVRINYQPIGSGGGIAQVKARTVDFGASDAPLKPADADEADLVQFPMVIGGVVPVVNLEGVKPGELRLNSEVFVSILLGEIRSWDDPKIQALNPGLKLPARDVTVVYRSDPSGTTWIFTHYLASASSRWKEAVGADKGVDWPVGIAGKGNQGVATYVSRVKGAIGYVEFAYAKLAGMTTVQLQNRDGEYVQATLESFQGAAVHADWTSAKNYYLILVNQPGKETWPITGASFILMQRKQGDPRHRVAMLKFFDWCFGHGADMAQGLDYVPMPPEVVELVRGTWRETWPEEYGHE